METYLSSVKYKHAVFSYTDESGYDGSVVKVVRTDFPTMLSEIDTHMTTIATAFFNIIPRDTPMTLPDIQITYENDEQTKSILFEYTYDKDSENYILNIFFDVDVTVDEHNSEYNEKEYITDYKKKPEGFYEWIGSKLYDDMTFVEKMEALHIR